MKLIFVHGDVPRTDFSYIVGRKLLEFHAAQYASLLTPYQARYRVRLTVLLA